MDEKIVNSYDEWSELNEVIVGCAEGFKGFHLDNSFNLFCWSNLNSFVTAKNFFRVGETEFEWPIVKIETKVVDELREDVEGFVEALKREHIEVRRPSSMVGNVELETPFWKSIQLPPLNIRDQTIILGSTIIETAPHVRSRLFENDYLKPLFYEYMEQGARWINMPRPSLCAGSLDPSFFSLSPDELVALQDHNAYPLTGLGFEMVFDGAQCIRLGKDVLVNVANKNHELGFQWLQTNFGDTFTFHRIERMADSHIDSMILPLRPGLWLIRDRQLLDLLPQKFRRWDCVIPPERKQYPFPSYVNEMYQSSKFLDMNILSLNENTVIINSLYPELITKLERLHFTVIPVRHRHGRIFGGSFHCFTLDVHRSGALQSYD